MLVLCGGNIDLTMLDRVIEVGLVADGRLSRFTVSISDRPGGLARLAEVIASTGASIKEIVHDRAFSGPDLSAVRVVCVVETTGHDHVRSCTGARRRGREDRRAVLTGDRLTARAGRGDGRQAGAVRRSFCQRATASDAGESDDVARRSRIDERQARDDQHRALDRAAASQQPALHRRVASAAMPTHAVNAIHATSSHEPCRRRLQQQRDPRRVEHEHERHDERRQRVFPRTAASSCTDRRR